MGKSVRKSTRKSKSTAGSQWAEVLPGESSPRNPGDSMQASQPGSMADPVAHDRAVDNGGSTETSPYGQQKKRAQAGDVLVRTPVRYPEDVKRAVVTAMIELNPDHPYSNASINAAHEMIGRNINKATLSSWIQTYGDEIREALPQAMTTQQIVNDTTSTVLQDFVTIRQKLIDHLKSDDTVDKMSGQHAALAMGIVHDKIQKLTALSPEDTQLMLRYIQVCKRYNVDYRGQMEDFCTHIEEYYSDVIHLPRLSSGN